MTRWCDGFCGRELPLTPEFFGPTGGRWLRKVCRWCHALERRTFRSTVRERARLSRYNREYFQRRGRQLQRDRRSAGRQV